MAVSSKPMTSTAVVPHGAVIRAMVFILRTIALILLVLSTFGNYVTFIGGWPQWSWSISWPMAGAAVAYQALFSVIQWGAKAARWWLVYTVALLASAVPSFLTYYGWAGSYLTVQVGAIMAFIIIGLATIGADALPEWVLVD